MATIFEELGSNLLARIVSNILWFGLTIMFVLVVGGIVWYKYIYVRKFNILVKVISVRARGEHIIFFDRAAILYDKKTKTDYFKFWGMKAELPVPDFDILEKTDKGDYLEVLRTKQNHIVYLTPPKIDKKYIQKMNGKVMVLADYTMRMIDPDTDFWNMKRKDLNKKAWIQTSLLEKLLPFLPHLISGAVIMIILAVILRSLPELSNLIAQLSKLTAELAKSQTANVITG